MAFSLLAVVPVGFESVELAFLVAMIGICQFYFLEFFKDRLAGRSPLAISGSDAFKPAHADIYVAVLSAAFLVMAFLVVWQAFR